MRSTLPRAGPADVAALPEGPLPCSTGRVRIIVVGAGLGGLALAQALLRAGDDILVLDRDADVDAADGYRITLDQHACAVLRRRLPPATYQALQASAGSRRTFQRFYLTDSRLRVLAVEQVPACEELLLIGRRPLRRLLHRDVAGHVRFRARAVDCRVQADGRASVTLDSGERLTADLVVVADGAGSRLAHRLAGRPTAAPTGVVGAALRVGLDAVTSPPLPTLLTTGHVMALTSEGIGCFAGVHDPSRPPVDPALCDPALLEPEPTGLVVGLWAPDGRWPAADLRAGGTRLLTHLVAATRGWDPELAALIASADPRSVAGFTFLAADPESDLTPWPAGPVTALGDAVHVMPPTGGQSGATAIRDADRLATHLEQVRGGAIELGTAIADYHRDVAGYAPAAIRESLEPLTWRRRISRAPVSQAAGLALPLAARLRHRRLSRRGVLDGS